MVIFHSYVKLPEGTSCGWEAQVDSPSATVSFKIFRALTSKWKQQECLESPNEPFNTVQKNIKYSLITNVTGNFDPHIVITPLQDAASSQQSSRCLFKGMPPTTRIRSSKHWTCIRVLWQSQFPVLRNVQQLKHPLKLSFRLPNSVCVQSVGVLSLTMAMQQISHHHPSGRDAK